MRQPVAGQRHAPPRDRLRALKVVSRQRYTVVLVATALQLALAIAHFFGQLETLVGPFAERGLFQLLEAPRRIFVPELGRLVLYLLHLVRPVDQNVPVGVQAKGFRAGLGPDEELRAPEIALGKVAAE